MYTDMTGSLPEVLANDFQKSLEVYACSYKPQLKTVAGYTPETVRSHLPLEEKALWFYTYCQENHLEGRIDTASYQIHPVTFSNGTPGWFVTVRADIYMNGKVIGTAVAGQVASLDNEMNLDLILQYASGIAKNRALCNAGFGLISGTDRDASGGNGSACASSGAFPSPVQPNGQPAPVMAQSQPTQTPAQSAPSIPNGQDGNPFLFGGNPPGSAPANPGESQEQMWAKGVICTLNRTTRSGNLKGMRMGDVLATNPETILWIAGNYKTDNDMKKSAQILLPEAKRVCGK